MRASTRRTSRYALAGIRGAALLTSSRCDIHALSLRRKERRGRRASPTSHRDDLMTYVTVSTGYRTPVYNARAGSVSIVNPSDLVIPAGAGSDDLTNYEVGLKARWLDGKLTTEPGGVLHRLAQHPGAGQPSVGFGAVLDQRRARRQPGIGSGNHVHAGARTDVWIECRVQRGRSQRAHCPGGCDLGAEKARASHRRMCRDRSSAPTTTSSALPSPASAASRSRMSTRSRTASRTTPGRAGSAQSAVRQDRRLHLYQSADRHRHRQDDRDACTWKISATATASCTSIRKRSSTVATRSCGRERMACASAISSEPTIMQRALSMFVGSCLALASAAGAK